MNKDYNEIKINGKTITCGENMLFLTVICSVGDIISFFNANQEEEELLNLLCKLDLCNGNGNHKITTAGVYCISSIRSTCISNIELIR